MKLNYNNLTSLLIWAEKLFIKKKIFFGHGTANAWDEAVFIASYVLNLNLYQDKLKEQKLNYQQQRKFVKLATLRANSRIPLPYLINMAWFAGKKFYVDPRVIIPRSPFAELISNKFSPWLKQPPLSILDLCTGSGCIAIACYYAFRDDVPTIKIDASDLSADALAIANKNLRLHRAENNINLFRSNLFAQIPQFKYDLIVSNPPYVDRKTFNQLPKEFKFEPKLALVSGDTGLELVIQILSNAANFLSADGVLIMEVGYLRKALQQYLGTKLDLTWLPLKCGGEGIFLVTKKQLDLIS